MSTKIICAIFFVVFFSTTVHAQNKLNIEILFESLCPDSSNFIQNQLKPAWSAISQHVNLKFVPFGKSISLENATKFVCQHGASECKGNRIMSCALKRISDQTVQVDFVSCFMNAFGRGRRNSNEFGQACIEAAKLNFNQVQQCYNTAEGTSLQLAAEEDTARISPGFIPTVVFNGIFNQQLQDESQINFKSVTCGLLKNLSGISC